MTDHADVIREAMDAQCEYHGTRWSEECRTCEYQQANVAALDTLVAALERGDSLLDQCGREHAAMFARAEAAEAEVARLQIALSLHPNTQAFLKQTELREAAEARVTELEAAMRQILDGEDPIRIAREMDDARAAAATPTKEGT